MLKLFRRTFFILFFSGVPVFAIQNGDVYIHGFVSQGFLKTDNINFLADTKDGSFQFNEIALNFSTLLSPGLRAGMQFFAYDLGKRGNDEINIEWCYADYQYRKWLGIRIGAIKPPHGLYNEIRDMDMLRTNIFLPHSIYSEVLRDELVNNTGVGLYGEGVSLGVMGDMSYLIILGQVKFDENKGIAEAGRILAESEFEKRRLNATVTVTDISAGYSVNGGVKWNTFIEGLLISVTGQNTNNMKLTTDVYVDDLSLELMFDNDILDLRSYIFSVQYTRSNFMLTYEYLRVNLNVLTTDAPSNPLLIYGETGDIYEEPMLDWYISLAYRFSSFFELAYTYSEHYTDKDDRDGSRYKNTGLEGVYDYQAWAKSSIVSTRFDMNPNWIIKFEYTYTDGQALFNPAQNDRLKRYYSMYGFKLTYIF